MDIELDRIAIWNKTGADGLACAKVVTGTSYMEPSNPVRKLTEPSKPMMRYAKDYSVQKVGFCLFVRTFETDEKKIEKQLDAIAKIIKKEQALEVAYRSGNEFAYLDKYIGDK